MLQTEQKSLNITAQAGPRYASCPGDIMTWQKLAQKPTIKLYAGLIPDWQQSKGLVGIRLRSSDHCHIQHSLTEPVPLPDDCVDSFQSEDVFEHIEYAKLPSVINEIYRLLKPGALLRISLPDYNSDIYKNRCVIDSNGKIISDPGGNGGPYDPPHCWFPTIENMAELLNKTKFAQNGRIEFLHYTNPDGTFVMKPIDYSKGLVIRTPDFDERAQNPARPFSLVVDLVKNPQKKINHSSEQKNMQALQTQINNSNVAETAQINDDNRLCQIAQHFLNQGHVVKALDAFEKASYLGPKNPNAHLGRALAFTRLGRLLEAEVAIRDLANLDRQNPTYLKYVEHFKKLKHTLWGERDIEWGWIKSELQKIAEQRTDLNIFDFGCGESADITLFAASLGFNVTATDMMQLKPSVNLPPNVSFRRADFLETQWPSENFDLIINCSAVEHAGLAGRYGVLKPGKDDDLKVMWKMRDIIKPDGKQLLVVPVGKDDVVGSLHRLYGVERLPKLLAGWKTLADAFFAKDENDKWVQVDRESALTGDGSQCNNIGLFILQKCPGQNPLEDAEQNQGTVNQAGLTNQLVSQSYEALWDKKLNDPQWVASDGKGRIEHAVNYINSLNLPDGIKLLDAGCGRGTLARMLNRNFHYTGIDISEKAIQQASQIYHETACVDINAQPLPFADNTFDLVTALDIIEHVFDPRYLLHEMYRVLKPGGEFILTTPNILCQGHINRMLRERKFPKTSTDPFPYDGGHLHFFTYRDCAELLTQRNFKNLTPIGTARGQENYEFTESSVWISAKK